MSELARCRAMHQYYRDVFTKVIYLPQADAMPAHIVTEIFNFTNGDIESLEPMIRQAHTGLTSEKDTALKNMLCAITVANQAFDGYNDGFQRQFPAELSARITENIVNALQLDNNFDYLVASIQVLFRANEIASALFLISNNLALLSDSGTVLKIFLLVCLMEGDLNQAQVIIQALTSDSELIGEDPMALLMIVCGIFQLGGIPDSLIDFRPLAANDYKIDTSRYGWLLEKTSQEKTTIMVACDKKYYFDHALALVYSVYETNRNELDVHLHLYNPDDELCQHVINLHQQFPELHISASFERVPGGPAAHVHYACCRFVFLSYALQHFNTPVLALNADLLLRKPWSESGPIAKQPLMLIESEAAPFWEEVFGGLLYAEPGSLAQKYFDIAARFIDINLAAGNSVWFLDQVALSASLETLTSLEKMSVVRLPWASVLDLNHERDVFCWIVTTSKNHQGAYHQYKTELLEKYQYSNAAFNGK